MIFQEAFARMSPSVTQHVALALLHFLWQGMLIVLVLALILRVLRDPPTADERKDPDRAPLPPDGTTRAGARYLISCFALAVMAALPLVNLVVLDVPAESVAAFDSGATADAIRGEPFATGAGAAAIDGMSGEARQAAVVEDKPTAAVLSSWAATACEVCLQWFFWAWIAGVALLSAWHLVGWVLSQNLRRGGTSPSDEALTLVRRIAGRLGIERAIDVRQTLKRTSPAVIGWIKPALILPVSMLTGLAPRELEAVLAHELAHVKRHDYLVNLVQAVVETLLFYHPAVWWVSRQIRTEREFCADDEAIRLCADRKIYVRSLVSLASLVRGSASHAVAATGGSLTSRSMRALYQTDCRSRTPRLAQRSAMAGLTATACLVVLLTTMSRGRAGDDLPPNEKAPGAATPAVADDQPKVADPSKTVRGENYFFVPWEKTELQLWLTGATKKPKEDYRALVLIDGSSLYTEDGKLNHEGIDWQQLARQLRPLADRDRGIVKFTVYSSSADASAGRVLSWALQGFGESRAGFKEAHVRQTVGGGKLWDAIDATTEQMAGREEGDEIGVGNELVKVYPVQTFLSCLNTGNADYVVRVVPRLNKNTGKALPPEIYQAILQTVPKVTTHRQEKKVQFRITYTQDAQATADWFIRQGRNDLAGALGFQDSSCSIEVAARGN